VKVWTALTGLATTLTGSIAIARQNNAASGGGGWLVAGVKLV
jgi:hypothetical protein